MLNLIQASSVEIKLSLSDNIHVYSLLNFFFQVKFSQYPIEGSDTEGRHTHMSSKKINAYNCKDILISYGF
jgi:hypothetical protein